MSTWAVVAAAGRGERLGLRRPKAFAPLRGRPLLAESLERLEASEWVDAIVIAAPPEWEEPSILLAEELGCVGVSGCRVSEVGESRSGRSELHWPKCHRMLTPSPSHDAARPVLPLEVIERVLAPLGEGWDGAVPALPLADTIKRVEGEQVAETLDRSGLVAVQTPQAFVAPALRSALAGDDVAAATDCAVPVERNGRPDQPSWATGGRLDITDAADLELVESLL